jgi:hypothetical protein
MSRHSLEHCADFVAFQVIYSTSWSALGGYSEKALALFNGLGISRRQEARKSMNGGQTGVASSDAILPLCFKVLQKRKNISSPQVLEFEINHATAVTGGEKAQQQHERVAVTQDRPGTEPSSKRQMLGEERTEGSGKLGRGWRHRRPPCTALGNSQAAE